MSRPRRLAAVVCAVLVALTALSACARLADLPGAQDGEHTSANAATDTPGADNHDTDNNDTDNHSAETDGLDAAPTTIEAGGRVYRRGPAVPWFDATLGHGTFAVTTGPKVRGACDEAFYRLVLSGSGQAAVPVVAITSYEYSPEHPDADRDCPAIGLLPAVASAPWPPGFAGVTSVVDAATGTSHPVRRLLLPPVLPGGLRPVGYSSDWPQVTDPTRPEPFGPFTSWSGPSGTLALGEYGDVRYQLPVVDEVQVRGVTAEVISGLVTNGDRCLQWTDTVTGNTYLCSAGNHGSPPLSVEELIHLADSLAPA